MSKVLKLAKANTSNPKLWIIAGVSVAGLIVLAETARMVRRRRAMVFPKEDFGAFMERFELLPFPQPGPPAARHTLSELKFAVQDMFDVKGYVTGFGSLEWAKTHEVSERTAVVITSLLKNGATCVGKTVMDEFGFGVTGQNKHYGTPTNPQILSCIPGGSCSGSAVAVAAQLVDFSLGVDTIGGVRIAASFCGILGYRPSHGVVSTIGVLPNSQSLDAVGWFARDPSTLHRVGLALLQMNQIVPKRSRRFIFADDLFQLSNVPKQKTVYVIRKVVENLSGYFSPEHVNLCQHIFSNVPSLKSFREVSARNPNGIFTLKALSSVMCSLQRHEFKTNHEDWIKSVKPRLGHDASDHLQPGINGVYENVKALYKVRAEMRSTLHSLLKDDGILVIPTIADPPLRVSVKKAASSEFRARALALMSIASMSGCCQVTLPLGKHDNSYVSVSFIALHGADRFLLDTVLDIFVSLQEQVNIASNSLPLTDVNGDMETSELLKEKGNAAFKGRQWNKAVNYYTEAIKLRATNATYYCNRAAAYLELGCFQQAEEDCNKAISFDKKNVKAYLRRGTARESVLRYREALQDFKHALVLEPHNKAAFLAEERLRKMMG